MKYFSNFNINDWRGSYGRSAQVTVEELRLKNLLSLGYLPAFRN